MSRKKGPEIDVEEKLHTSYRTISDDDEEQEREARSHKTSDKVLTEKRHYCRHCKRKRDEGFMKVVGRGAYGKQSWACVDQATCLAIRDLKRRKGVHLKRRKGVR